MRHLVCRSFGTSDGLVVQASPDPEPGPGEVRVRIHASNIAFVDRLLVRGSYQFRPPVPFTPGVVGAGVVVSTGDDVKHLQPGHRVAVLKADFGVWSTDVVVSADAVVQMPSGVSDVAAVSSIEAYGTASYALEDRGRVRAGDTVLVLGASGAVGHAAVEVALHLDARVIAVTSDPDLWAGAKIKPHFILDRRTTHLREAMRELFPDGVDIVVDPVGGPMSEAALRSLNFGGRHLIVGFASGAIPKLPVNYVLLRNRTVVGVEWASWIRANPKHVARSMEIVLTRLARGAFSAPAAETVTLDELPEVLLASVPASGLRRTVVLPQARELQLRLSLQRAKKDPQMTSNLRHRLSAHDAVFLYWERAEQPFHVCECMVYKGKFTAKDISRMLEERMHLLPRYRQKVVFSPMQMAHPTWEDDPAFDLKNHIAEVDLPAPHDDIALSRFGGELFSGLIDREHPLWHLTVIHGHVSGNTIVFLKLHHAMVDGVSSVELIEVLHSTEKGAKPPPAPPDRWQPKPLPSVSRRFLDALADQTETVLDFYRGAANLLRAPSLESIGKRIKTLAGAAVDSGEMALLPPPKTPFNKPISAARQFCWLELPLEEVHRVRKHHGATVNDLVLTVLAGGLGRYMKRQGHNPAGVELRSMCPVSVRARDQSGALGNQISMVAAPLHVGIDDPLQRLDAEMQSMRKLKEKDQAGGMFEMISAAKYYPAWVWKEIWARWPMQYFPFNIVSTNVPGPKTPLYLDQHELLHWYPFGVNWTTSGLFLCTLSYREYLVLGLVADPTIVDDVWAVNEDLRAAYEELKVATVGGSIHRRPAAKAPARPRVRTGTVATKKSAAGATPAKRKAGKRAAVSGS